MEDRSGIRLPEYSSYLDYDDILQLSDTDSDDVDPRDSLIRSQREAIRELQLQLQELKSQLNPPLAVMNSSSPTGGPIEMKLPAESNTRDPQSSKKEAKQDHSNRAAISITKVPHVGLSHPENPRLEPPTPESQPLRNSYSGRASGSLQQERCAVPVVKQHMQKSAQNPGSLNVDDRHWTQRFAYSPDTPRRYELWPDARPFKPAYSANQSGTWQSPNPLPLTNVGSYLQTQPYWMPQRTLLEEVGMKFSGRDAAEYPAYRHRFLVRQNELRHTRPDLLLRWIESTVDGEAKRYIRNAFAIFDPGEACDVIWSTLEEVYGRKEVILEHAMQQVERPRMSVKHDKKVLLEFRADLRSLQGIAKSVGQETALKKARLMGKIYSGFNEKLRTKFDAQYPANKWNFEDFLEFLTTEISYIDSLHLMHVDRATSFVQKRISDGGNTFFNRKPQVTRVGAAVKDTKTSEEHVKRRFCCLHPNTVSHDLAHCRSFMSMNVNERWDVVKEHRLCFVCFGNDHGSKTCFNGNRCRKCKFRHNTLLHKDEATTSHSKTTDQSYKSKASSPKQNGNKRPAAKETTPLGYLQQSCSRKGRVALMRLTAATGDSDQSGPIFCAEIDTGATSSLG